jgi:hypothetical protein
VDVPQQPAGQAVPRSPQFLRLTEAGCPAATAQQLTGMGLTDAQLDALASRGPFDRSDWAAVVKRIRDHGPQAADDFAGASHVPTPAVALAVPAEAGEGTGTRPDGPAAVEAAPGLESVRPAAPVTAP